MKPSTLTPVPASEPQAAPRAQKVSPELGLKGHASPIQGRVQPVCRLGSLGQTLVTEAMGRPLAKIQRPILRRTKKKQISKWVFVERTDGCSGSRRWFHVFFSLSKSQMAICGDGFRVGDFLKIGQGAWRTSSFYSV